MKKSLFSTFVFIFSITSLFSQSNFRSGYIIKSKNDTVFGLIDLRTNLLNSTQCKFKLGEKESEEIYHPGEIIGYRFIDDGKYYVSKTVEIDSVKKTVFLEFLVQGLINLYYLPKDNDYYFFEDKDGSLIGVTHSRVTLINSDVNNPLPDNKYKGVLSYMFRDDMSLAEKTANAEFTRKSMIEYTKEFHNKMCTSGDKCIIFENDYSRKFAKLIYYIYSGVELNTMKIIKSPINSIPGTDVKLFTVMSSISPVIGGGVNISNSRISKLISLKFDAGLSRITGESKFSYDNFVLTQNSYTFNALKSTLGVGLDYLTDKGKIRPAAEIGLSFNQIINPKSKVSYLVKNSYDSNVRTRTIENELNPQSSSGFKIGAGFDYKLNSNHFILIRVLFSQNKDESDINNTYQLKIGYKF